MQLTPSREIWLRAQSGVSRDSPSWVPTCWWQRTQKVPTVPCVRSWNFCSNLWNIGEIDA